jgi:hypothetical protein
MTNAVLDPELLVQRRMSDHDITVFSLEKRIFPEETIIVIKVAPEQRVAATTLANSIDHELAEQGFAGFLTVREVDPSVVRGTGALRKGVFDPRANELANLLTARSRTSEVQPSLLYIRDASDNLSSVMAARHHLIFGRRGSGKTALMVEAKRAVIEAGSVAVWLNLQSLRSLSAHQCFSWFVEQLGDAIQVYYASRSRAPRSLAAAAELKNEVSASNAAGMGLWIPRAQQLVRRFLEAEGIQLFVFVDELHYLPRAQQPVFLDYLHGSVRDCDAWLKVAGIRNLSRWFVAEGSVGLQTGQDADHIDLDITLEDPPKAKTFLEEMLRSYARYVGIGYLAGVFSNEALDRLILASGAVPRDYLVLGAAGIREAQKRPKAKTVGVQDINKVAGDAAKVKIAELEDDAAATAGSAQRIAEALNIVREFCIAKRNSTYFRIDFRDREEHQPEHSLLQGLVDLRLLHLVDSSLSDEREAGRRSEVYMLDLSQYSGQRLRKRLKVLDFDRGHIILKETGSGEPPRVAKTTNQRLAILRRGPALELTSLTPVLI